MPPTTGSVLRDVFELMKTEATPFVARFRKGPAETLGAAVACSLTDVQTLF